MSGASSEESIDWISWFCSLKGNELLCMVNVDYITDRFNLTGLNELIPRYEDARKFLIESETWDDENSASEVNNGSLTTIEQNAELLYTLIHARYILSNEGLSRMLEKWKNGDFGTCPRWSCDKFRLLPLGESESLRESTVRMYCARCQDIFQSKQVHAEIDGAFFGPSFPHMFFMVYPKLVPKNNNKTYVPRMYGFKISPQALELQRAETDDEEI